MHTTFENTDPRRGKNYNYVDMTPARGAKRPVYSRDMELRDGKLVGEWGEVQRERLAGRLETLWKTRFKRQWPLDEMHRLMRLKGLLHCQINLDPPNWVTVWAHTKKPKYVYDRYGRLLYMEKGKKELKRIRPEDFAPVIRFEPLYPPHPNPAKATEAEKEERVPAFLNAYATTALATASAQYVGVNYFQIVLWINERKDWQEALIVAEAAAKLVMVDVGKQRAMAGDSSLIRFFIERENPEKYGLTKKKDDGNKLPDGVTDEAVAAALANIGKAQGAMSQAAAAGILTTGNQGELGGEINEIVGLPSALVNQTSPFDDISPSPWDSKTIEAEQ